MKAPRVSKFASRQFKIQFDESIESEGVLCDGLCSSGNRVIQIRKGLSPEETAETLVHETMHQMLLYSGIQRSEEEEEAVVDYMAKALIAHMMDNKGYWQYVNAQLTAGNK